MPPASIARCRQAGLLAFGAALIVASIAFPARAFPLSPVTGAEPHTLLTCPSVFIAPPVLPNGTVGVAYPVTTFTSGGTSPVTYAVTTGALPDGLTLSSAGVLSGTPTTATALASFTITATDVNLCTGASDYILAIEADAALFTQKLIANDGVASDGLGRSAAISADGNTLALGASTSPAGAVYVFVRNGSTWSQQAKLTPADGAEFFGFGNWISISADGNTILTGAPDTTIDDDTFRGTAYVFTRSGVAWTQEAVLQASNGRAEDRFGRAGAIGPDGQTVIIGASMSDAIGGGIDPDAGPGTAYVFTKSAGTWTQHQELIGSDVGSGEEFGAAVAIAVNTAVIGATLADGVTLHAGAAYVFGLDGGNWVEEAKLTANDGACGDAFGSSARISDDENTIVVTAPFACPGGSGYVFTRNGSSWDQVKLVASRDDTIFLGADSALNGDTALLSDPQNYFQQGNVFAFVRSGATWTERSMLTPGDDADAEFGTGVAMRGDLAVVGAPAATISGHAGQGAAYVFRLQPVVTSITPATGSTNGGTPLTIRAANAATDTAVTLGGTALGSLVVNGAVVTGTTPGHLPGSVNLVLTNPSTLGATVANAFTYVCPAISVVPATLPGASQGVPYSQTLTASGSVLGVTFAVTSGALPTGISLSSGGMLSGTPTQIATANFTVTATDANTCAGSTPYTVVTSCPTAACFSDEPLAAGLVPIKVVHFVEMRDRINAARASIGLAAAVWTDPTLVAGVTATRAQHLLELRTALTEAYQAAHRTPPTYTDPTLVPQQTGIRTVHIEELRAAIVAFEQGPTPRQ